MLFSTDRNDIHINGIQYKIIWYPKIWLITDDTSYSTCVVSAEHYHEQFICGINSIHHLVCVWKLTCQFHKPKRSTSNAKACFHNTTANELLLCLSSSRMLYQQWKNIIECRRMVTHWHIGPKSWWPICVELFCWFFRGKIDSHIAFDGVMIWKCFPHNWPFVRRSHLPHAYGIPEKGPVLGELMVFTW